MSKNKKQKVRENEDEDICDEEMIAEETNNNIRIPPLLILEAKELKDNPVRLKNEIRENLSGIDIKQIKFTKNNNMLIYLNKHSDYHQLTNENVDVKIGGKNFTTLKSKLYPFVVKGINYATSNEFQEELSNIGIVNSKEIKSIRFSNQTINKVILYCDNQAAVNEHLSKGYIFINFIKYRTEEYKPPIRLTTCYKCQRFGHIAKQCKATNQVCPKCGKDDHATDVDGKLLCTSEKKQCINCNQEHSSAYAGCQKKKQLIQDIKNKRNIRPSTEQLSARPTLTLNNTNNKVTYASKLIGNNSNHINISSQDTIIEQLNCQVKNLQSQLSQAKAHNQQLITAISNLEQKQVETNTNLTNTLIDFFLLSGKKTDSEKNRHILSSIINKNNATSTITIDYINSRQANITNIANSWEHTVKQQNNIQTQPLTQQTKPTTSQQANQQNKSQVTLKQSTLNINTNTRNSLSGTKS